MSTTQSQLQQALYDREELDRKILELRQLEATLRAVIEHDAFAREGEETISTEEVRNVLYARRGEILTAVDVKEELEKLGYSLAKYQSPLAAIGVILNRLRDKGEIEAASGVGKRGFIALSIRDEILRQGDRIVKGETVPVPAAHPLQKLRAKPKRQG
ncbi:MAG: hypothetical protein WAN65_03030 [Candidatus Sulfotelmatobacter sp.]